MKTIAFDVMGNDNGIKVAIDAASEFVNNNLDYIVTLVGDAGEIKKYISENERIKIYNAPAPTYNTSVARSARNEVNSMTVAINLVKDGEADAVLSAGNSGMYLTSATLLLKRIEGVRRPAFAPIMPTIEEDKKFFFLDVGANVETTSEMLHQWAIMGSAFTKAVLNIKNPKVGLVNIGTEEGKGKEFHTEAAKLLKEDKRINYYGFVETRDLINGKVDVAVIDGYAGNMTLKAYEGAITSLLTLIRREIKSKLRYKMGYLLSKGAFKKVKDSLDYKSVGAAWVIGLNGLVIKAHGSSDKQTLLSALKQVDLAITSDALSKFKKEFMNDNK